MIESPLWFMYVASRVTSSCSLEMWGMMHLTVFVTMDPLRSCTPSNIPCCGEANWVRRPVRKFLHILRRVLVLLIYIREGLFSLMRD